MLINPQNLSLTLFVSVLISLAVTSVEAHDFAQPIRRDHDNLKRLIRKRSPDLAAIINAVGDPNTSTDPNAGVAGASLSASGSSSASAQVDASASASASNTGSISASAASQSVSASGSASASAAATSASASFASASASKSSPATPSVPPSAPPPQTPAANANANETPASQSQSTVTKTNSILAAAETNPSTPPPQSATAVKKSTITTILIVVAASVGGVAILWTVFRKWKLGHSKKFDERMAPIDWQPTNDDGIIPAHRRANSRASSFNSAAHGNGGYSERDHDFTAAPSHLAPVGGYADLARGPSPQPQMQEVYGQDLTRGPSTTRPAYDTGVPLHHQAGFGQAEAYDYNGDAIRF
ncbi:hypothetical protein B0H12DRAFT_1086222 [Mycena haematopus]|nr:hypothetical protein B0H12DRAFT_1086222 [Mycena haematopus]